MYTQNPLYIDIGHTFPLKSVVNCQGKVPCLTCLQIPHGLVYLSHNLPLTSGSTCNCLLNVHEMQLMSLFAFILEDNNVIEEDKLMKGALEETFTNKPDEWTGRHLELLPIAGLKHMLGL